MRYTEDAMWYFWASDNQKMQDVDDLELSDIEARSPNNTEGVRDVRQGEYIARSGDPAQSRFYIIAGVLGIEYPDTRGRVALVDTLERGDVARFSTVDKMKFSIRAVTSARLFACSAKTVSLGRGCRTLDGTRADRDAAASVANRLAMAVLRRNADPSIRIASYLLARFNRSEPQLNGREILNLGEALPQLPDLVGTTADILRQSLAGLVREQIIAFMPAGRLHLLNRKQLERFALG